MRAVQRAGIRRVVGVAGLAIGFGALLTQLGFFFRPGISEVLGGLAHHAFVLGVLIVATARSRTVSLTMLVAFWLVGLWAVFGLSYMVQLPFAGWLGAEDSDSFVPDWWAPISEEALKLLPVAAYLALTSHARRQSSPSDGLLLGFMVGAGFSLHEDAHVGDILVSGDGWSAAMPWSILFPTITPEGNLISLNHALWAALSGLGIGCALLFRHRRWAWLPAVAGPGLAMVNHMMMNLSDISTLQALNREDPPAPFSILRVATDGGRLTILLLVAAVLAVVLAEWLILRWVARRDRIFPALSVAPLARLLPGSPSRAGAKRLFAADRYLRLRRSIYFAAWRTRNAGGHPRVNGADYAELMALLARARALPAPETPAPADSGLRTPGAEPSPRPGPG